MNGVNKTPATSFAILAAVLGTLASTAFGVLPTELTNGVPVTGLSDTIDGETFYKIEVPPGQSELEISISGGTGDCDLYVRKDLLPTTSEYDYRPFFIGNDETVTVIGPDAGTWYIMLHAAEAYDDVALVAAYGAAVPSLLDNGVPVEDISGSAGSEQLYHIDVPPGQARLEFNTWNGAGDVDVYVKHGAPPSVFDYDDSSTGGGTTEMVSIDSPAAGTWYVLLAGESSYFGVTLRALYGNFDAVLSLEDEVPITGLAGPAGSEECYRIEVPEGQEGIRFQISGGTGDCDMYIKRGARPTDSDWDYHPVQSGNDESISLGDMEGGDWYVRLKAAAAYSDVTLEADYFCFRTSTLTPLENGIPVTSLADCEGGEQFFTIEVPEGMKELEIKMFGGAGDADLYVRHGAAPTITDYDYRPYGSGNDEKVNIKNPAAGVWHIMIRAYQGYSNVTLVATFGNGPLPDDTPALLNGIPIPDLAGVAGSQKFYKIELPAGRTQLKVQISGGSGDADLYVRKGAKPTTTQWDYRPYLIGNDETITIDDPEPAVYYVMLRGYTAYDGVTLKATWLPATEDIPTIENGVPVIDLSDVANSERFFKIEVPAGQKLLAIRISGGAGDADLYVRKGAKPTTAAWDYRPYLHGNNESVLVEDPAATTWYIMVRGYQAYSGLTLQASFTPPGEPAPEK